MKIRSIEKNALKQAYDSGLEAVEDAIIDAFLTRKVEADQSGFLETLIRFFERNGFFKDIYTLAFGFQYLVTDADRYRNNGVVFTPREIAHRIISLSFESQDAASIGIDPACGCGNFLIEAALFLSDRDHQPVSWVVSNRLFGVDVDSRSVRIARKLLKLLVEIRGEQFTGCNITMQNSLEKDFYKSPTKKFDCVFGNPPYVRYRNMDNVSKALVDSMAFTCGDADMYISFFEIGLSLVADNGLVTYITPNTWLKSVNGREMRRYLCDTRCDVAVLNFGDTELFPGVSHYYAITSIRHKGEGNVDYSECLSLSRHDERVRRYQIEDLGPKAWVLSGNEDSDELLSLMATWPNSFSNLRIRNGIATLKNDVFIFKPDSEDELYFYRTISGRLFPIEKEVCRPIIKPNIIKKAEDISRCLEQAVFPYVTNENGKLSLISEDTFQSKYPKAYEYLLFHKESLLKRDKGKAINYDAWYQYGRTQGLTYYGSKVLFPYICGHPIAVYESKPMLFYCGYAVFCKDEDEARLVEFLMTSELYWYFILKTSKPYSKGYMAVAKNYVIGFRYPELSKKDISLLIDPNRPFDKKNMLLCERAGIPYDKIHEFVRKKWVS